MRTAFIAGAIVSRIAGQSQKNRVGIVRAAIDCHGAIVSLVLGATIAYGRVTLASRYATRSAR